MIKLNQYKDIPSYMINLDFFETDEEFEELIYEDFIGEKDEKSSSL